jgi:hypothetical protein
MTAQKEFTRMQAASRHAVLPAVIMVVALALSGCVSVNRDVAQSPFPPPPPIPAETIPKPPVSEAPLVWQPGHWDFTGNGYVYRNGAWVLREGHGTEWQDGYWADRNGNWTWVPAHWL